jgi:hypothetical protein
MMNLENIINDLNREISINFSSKIYLITNTEMMDDKLYNILYNSIKLKTDNDLLLLWELNNCLAIKITLWDES